MCHHAGCRIGCIGTARRHARGETFGWCLKPQPQKSRLVLPRDGGGMVALAVTGEDRVKHNGMSSRQGLGGARNAGLVDSERCLARIGIGWQTLEFIDARKHLSLDIAANVESTRGGTDHWGKGSCKRRLSGA